MSERLQRQAKMVEMIRSNDGVTIDELKSAFGVSAVTIRKDLEDLERHGLILRKFGGAIPSQLRDLQDSFNVRTQLNAEEKKWIGQTAVSLIKPMESIIIDAGSTPLEIVRHLRHDLPLTIITPAVNVALEACELPNVTVMIPGGGVMDRFTLSLVGIEAEEGISRMHADKVFLGIRGIDLHHGLTDTDTYRIRLKQIMIKSSRQVIVVADFEQIRQRLRCWMSLHLMWYIPLLLMIEIDPAMCEELKSRGISVLIASNVN